MKPHVIYATLISFQPFSTFIVNCITTLNNKGTSTVKSTHHNIHMLDIGLVVYYMDILHLLHTCCIQILTGNYGIYRQRQFLVIIQYWGVFLVQILPKAPVLFAGLKTCPPYFKVQS